MSRVELEITPIPTPEERAAIAAALSELSAVRREAPNPWWEAGAREALEEEPD